MSLQLNLSKCPVNLQFVKLWCKLLADNQLATVLYALMPSGFHSCNTMNLQKCVEEKGMRKTNKRTEKKMKMQERLSQKMKLKDRRQKTVMLLPSTPQLWKKKKKSIKWTES